MNNSYKKTKKYPVGAGQNIKIMNIFGAYFEQFKISCCNFQVQRFTSSCKINF